MKRATCGALVALVAGGCMHGVDVDKVHAGMSREEVASIMGQPTGSTNANGRDCQLYTVSKDFWSRVPWNMTDRYVVCYTDDRVETFGLSS